MAWQKIVILNCYPVAYSIFLPISAIRVIPSDSFTPDRMKQDKKK